MGIHSHNKQNRMRFLKFIASLAHPFHDVDSLID